MSELARIKLNRRTVLISLGTISVGTRVFSRPVAAQTNRLPSDGTRQREGVTVRITRPALVLDRKLPKQADLPHGETRACLETARRKQHAREIRSRATADALAPLLDQWRNTDREDIGIYTQFTKSVRHFDETGTDPKYPQVHGRPGQVVPTAFEVFEKALDSRTFERIDEGAPEYAGTAETSAYANRVRLSNPVSGFAYDLEGFDTHLVRQKPAPSYRSDETVAELAELYLLALARDRKFHTTPDPGLRHHVDLLRGYSFYRDVEGLDETTIFRAYHIIRDERNPDRATRIVPFPGVNSGPFISQFLLRGNVETIDPSKPPCEPPNIDITAGVVRLGSLRLSQRQRTVLEGVDYMTAADNWLAVQQGVNLRGTDQFDICQFRYIRSPRDGANYVHFDKIYQEYLVAACILLAEIPSGFLGVRALRDGDSKTPAVTPRQVAPGDVRPPEVFGRPVQSEAQPADANVLNIGNPYRWASTNQAGFATFGLTQITTLLAEVATRAHKAVWLQKWHVHRRLRPEEYAGQLHFRKTQPEKADYPIPDELLLDRSGLLAMVYAKFRSYFLAQAFPEGSPVHPSYGAGHATLAGAAVTALKGVFNGDYRFDRSVEIADPETGLALRARRPDCQPEPVPLRLSVTGELNKLASNIAFFRT